MSDPNDPNQPVDPPAYPSYPQTPPPPPPPPPPYGSTPPPPPPPAYGGYQPYPGLVPQSPYAHWGLRLAGYLIDSVLPLPLVLVAVVALAAGSDPDTGDPSTGGLIVGLVLYLVTIVFTIWNQIVRQGRTGQSLGKKWVGIRLVKEENGLPLGGWLAFGRGLLHILDALPCYVGFLWPLWDDKRQTFADKIVKSVVLRADAPLPAVQAPPPAATW